MRNRDKAYLGSAADMSEHNEKPAIGDDSYGLNGETLISQDRQLNQQIDKVALQTTNRAEHWPCILGCTSTFVHEGPIFDLRASFGRTAVVQPLRQGDNDDPR